MRNFGGVFLLMTALATSARAESKSDQAVARGLQLRREGRDTEALALFREAFEADAAPRTKAQIALAEQALGQWVEAERDLELALAASGDSWISSHRETLVKALETIRKHLATLEARANTANAELWLNGVKVGRLPLGPLRIVSGRASLEARAEGFEPAVRSIEVAPGQTASEEFRLKPIDEPKPAPVPSVVVESQPAAPSKPPAGPEIAPAPTGYSTRMALAWGTLGAAGAFLGGAITAQVIREQKASYYNDDAQCLGGSGSRDASCGVYRGQVESAQLFATIGYVAAGTLGIASMVLFLTAPSPKAPVATGLRIDVGTAGASMAWRGTF